MGASTSFFFQAEDGIRDAQESRGLGDVYKRQTVVFVPRPKVRLRWLVGYGLGFGVVQFVFLYWGTVSYTHLTLPTIYPV